MVGPCIYTYVHMTILIAQRLQFMCTHTFTTVGSYIYICTCIHCIIWTIYIHIRLCCAFATKESLFIGWDHAYGCHNYRLEACDHAYRSGDCNMHGCCGEVVQMGVVVYSLLFTLCRSIDHTAIVEIFASIYFAHELNCFISL